MLTERVRIAIAGVEVAKWAASHVGLTPPVAALASGRVVITGVWAGAAVRDVEERSGLSAIPMLDEDATLELIVNDARGDTRADVIVNALELADLALGGLLERVERIRFELGPDA